MTISWNIRHDGQTNEFKSVKSKAALARVDSFRRGALIFWVHSKLRLRISELQTDADLDREIIAGLRGRWIERRLRELF